MSDEVLELLDEGLLAEDGATLDEAPLLAEPPLLVEGMPLLELPAFSWLRRQFARSRPLSASQLAELPAALLPGPLAVPEPVEPEVCAMTPPESARSAAAVAEAI